MRSVYSDIIHWVQVVLHKLSTAMGHHLSVSQEM